MIKIVGKSANIKDQMSKSLRDGFESIELQLMGSFVNENIDDILEKIKRDNEPSISSVHTPIINKRAAQIEDIQEHNKKLVIQRSMYLADRIGAYMGINVPVVLHMHSSVEEMKERGDMLYSLAREIKNDLDLYTHISLCIENEIPVDMYDNRVINGNCYMYDNADFVRWMREEQGIERIYTVLDTCHMRMSQKVMGLMYTLTKQSVPSIEEYFKYNSDVIKIVHLNNVKGWGLTEEEHSKGFEGDEDILQEIVRNIEKYCIDADIVLELNEEDYISEPNKNKIKTLEIMDRLGIEYEIKKIKKPAN